MTLFGYGKTNAAIAKKFGNCRIYDDKFKQVETYGTNTLLPMELFDPAQSELEVPTPGIPPHHPQVSKARNLIGEYDLFADTMPFSIWISGTNGKTTTTEMIGHLLANRGAVIGGNVGTPVAELDEKAPIWVLETSSFTLHYTNKARPNIYLLLPITPDHITWHGSMEAYEAAKLKPLATMREGELVILPAKYRHVPTKGFAVYYENAADIAAAFGIDLARLKFEGPFLMDAAMALAVTKSLFDTIDYDLINRFVLDPHKIERVTDKKGRLWIDDSKATNYDATLQAVEAFRDKPLHLILGGDDKGADLTPLFDVIDKLDVQIYAIGANRDKLMQMAEERGIDATLCGFLEVAVAKIDQKLDKNGVGMLSPAAASLDQFSSYKERGEKFKEFIAALS
ncbi:MAG: UDP-N-acetylmuramoyl-L-alanine--D-glutamate ligase [Campylobacterales bacterium]